MEIKKGGLFALALALAGLLLLERRENRALCRELDDVHDELFAVDSKRRVEKSSVERLKEEFERRTYELEQRVYEMRHENAELSRHVKLAPPDSGTYLSGVERTLGGAVLEKPQLIHTPVISELPPSISDFGYEWVKVGFRYGLPLWQQVQATGITHTCSTEAANARI